MYKKTQKEGHITMHMGITNTGTYYITQNTQFEERKKKYIQKMSWNGIFHVKLASLKENKFRA